MSSERTENLLIQILETVQQSHTAASNRDNLMDNRHGQKTRSAAEQNRAVIDKLSDIHNIGILIFFVCCGIFGVYLGEMIYG